MEDERSELSKLHLDWYCCECHGLNATDQVLIIVDKIVAVCIHCDHENCRKCVLKVKKNPW